MKAGFWTLLCLPALAWAGEGDWAWSLYSQGEAALTMGGPQDGKLVINQSGAKVKYGALGLGVQAAYRERLLLRARGGYGASGSAEATYNLNPWGLASGKGDAQATVAAVEAEWVPFPDARWTPFVQFGLHHMKFDADLTEVRLNGGLLPGARVLVDSEQDATRAALGLRWHAARGVRVDAFYGRWRWDLAFKADGYDAGGTLQKSIDASGRHTDPLYGIGLRLNLTPTWYLNLDYEERDMKADTAVKYRQLQGVLGYRF